MLEAILWLTLNIYHEARGESQLGQIAVAHVTLNRATKRNLSIKAVINQPKQFSWRNTGDKSLIPDDPQAFWQCLESAMVSLNGFDFTMNSTYYHATSIKPSWTHGMIPTITIDNHQFYYENK